ncbi:MAG TPA: hypothetical protein VGV35_11400 [Bryobacteraceae bacterium]|nr:hypothetical protein [Bryobacteraceae bacterium]
MKILRVPTFAAGVQAFRIVSVDDSNGERRMPEGQKPARTAAAEQLGKDLWKQVGPPPAAPKK